MTPGAIIREAEADGVRLALSSAGAIKAIGNSAAVNRWLALIRERKPEVVEVLTVRAWLALLGETDPATLAELIERCRHDPQLRAYVSQQAKAEQPGLDSYPDDRRTCGQCFNLLKGRCQAARRGEIAASRSYEPVRDLPRRCEAYRPKPDEADRRSGLERWPGLLQLQSRKP